MGKEAYVVNFRLVLAISTLSDGYSTSKDRSTHERSPEDRLCLLPATDYMTSAVLPHLKRNMQTRYLSRVWYIMIPDKLCWHLNKRVRKEHLFLNQKYIQAWQINKNLLSTPKQKNDADEQLKITLLLNNTINCH